MEVDKIVVGGREVEVDDLTAFLHAGAGSYRCGIYLYNLDPLSRQQIYHELETQRLMDKYNKICERYDLLKDWDRLFFVSFMETLSDKANRGNYMSLAMMIPQSLIKREQLSVRRLETLMIGVSGLLSTLPKDKFTEEIRKEAEYMMHKYNISPMDADQWRVGLRVKHPIIRISQVAHFLYNNRSPFNRLLKCTTREDVFSFFNHPASAEWCRYFENGAVSHIGRDKCDLLGINLIVPMLFAFGHYSADDEMVNTACELNEALPVESNGIIAKWKYRGLTPQSAFEAQALLQLQKIYCSKDGCHKCVVFKHICSKANILSKVPIFLENMR